MRYIFPTCHSTDGPRPRETRAPQRAHSQNSRWYRYKQITTIKYSDGKKGKGTRTVAVPRKEVPRGWELVKSGENSMCKSREANGHAIASNHWQSRLAEAPSEGKEQPGTRLGGQAEASCNL